MTESSGMSLGALLLQRINIVLMELWLDSIRTEQLLFHYMITFINTFPSRYYVPCWDVASRLPPEIKSMGLSNLDPLYKRLSTRCFGIAT